MSQSHYATFLFWNDQDETFIALAPQLQGCVAHGDTRAEAIENIEASIAEWLQSAKEEGWEIPAPMSDAEYAKQSEENNRRQREEFERNVRETVTTILNRVMPKISEQLFKQLAQASAESPQITVVGRQVHFSEWQLAR